ncbi:MAG TPA: TerC family protein [Anaerolineales bacterium]|nr:TerC family protein [Anaerolineales bacterium]
MDWISDPQAWIGLLTLTALEVVLGIDNIVFISILAGKLPSHQQAGARRLGLAVAMVSRIALLLSLTWIMRLTAPLFSVFGHVVSGRDLILMIGGLFLLAKSTHEIHGKLEGLEEKRSARTFSFWGVIVQIMLLDIVFSLDSVITAVGMINNVSIMVIAIIIAVAIMMIFSGVVSDFVDHHPTIKMLALSFLLMIGLLLVADGTGFHIPKGYAYFAMGFSIFVEMLNLRMGARAARPVQFHELLKKE